MSSGRDTNPNRLSIKTGDTEPVVEITPSYSNGSLALFDGTEPVQFVMTVPGQFDPAVDNDGSYENSPDTGNLPVLRYEWQPGDTNEPGEYWAEFQVTRPGGRVESFPSGRYLLVVILPSL